MGRKRQPPARVFTNQPGKSALQQWADFHGKSHEDIAELCARAGWDANWKTIENICYGNKPLRGSKALTLQHLTKEEVPAGEILAFHSMKQSAAA